MRLNAPTPLTAAHRLDGFDCGQASLNDWLMQRALKNQQSDVARTYVVCQEGQHVVGYYCLSAGAITHTEAPKAMRRNRPDPLPIIVLGRLAVDKRYHNQGIGQGLLRDALQRVVQHAEELGIVAVLVHALNDAARQFYLSRGFVASPIQPMTLCIPLARVRAALS